MAHAPCRLALAVALAGLVLASPARGQDFATVTPTRVEAGAFYAGTTIRIEGQVSDGAHVAIRLLGPSEPQTYNRRGKILG